MRIVWTEQAWEDYQFWVEGRGRNATNVKRIGKLVKDIVRDPEVTDGGIGRPERLTGNLAGTQSRRIDQEHRLVYIIDGADLVIIQARKHY